jgi:tRNA-2-methylthio-N6-dimethylallyladenosine synthase
MSQVAAAPNVVFGAPPRRKRGTYFIQTWGCQMNEEDSEQIALHLESIGYERSEILLGAQVIVLNTCSVRKKPEDKAFSLLGELIPLKRRDPEVILGVCGCMAQARADEIKRRAPHVDFVLGTGNLGLLPGIVDEVAQTRRFQKRVDLPERKGAIVEDVPQRHLGRRAALKSFVPIQYGCDKF